MIRWGVEPHGIKSQYRANRRREIRKKQKKKKNKKNERQDEEDNEDILLDDLSNSNAAAAADASQPPNKNDNRDWLLRHEFRRVSSLPQDSSVRFYRIDNHNGNPMCRRL